MKTVQDSRLEVAKEVPETLTPVSLFLVDYLECFEIEITQAVQAVFPGAVTTLAPPTPLPVLLYRGTRDIVETKTKEFLDTLDSVNMAKPECVCREKGLPIVVLEIDRT